MESGEEADGMLEEGGGGDRCVDLKQRCWDVDSHCCV